MLFGGREGGQSNDGVFSGGVTDEACYPPSYPIGTISSDPAAP